MKNFVFNFRKRHITIQQPGRFKTWKLVGAYTQGESF